MSYILKQSAMRNAFCNMAIKPSQHKSHGSVISSAIKSAEHGSGMYNTKDFNAHLSLKTYNILHRQGVMV